MEKRKTVYPESDFEIWDEVEKDEAKEIIAETIKLKRFCHPNNGYYIAEPSGIKVTASMLKPGKCYLHKNLLFIREITSMKTNGDVWYKDDRGFPRVCSKAHFVTRCPWEATEDESYFLDEYSEI